MMRRSRHYKLLLKIVTAAARACRKAALTVAVVAIAVAISTCVVLSRTPEAAGAVATTQRSLQCDRVSLLDHTSELQLLNSGIDLARSTGYVRKQLEAIDPTTVSNTSLEASSLSLLGLDFRVTPFVQAMQVAGIATAVPQHVNITSATTAVLGVALDGALRLNGTVQLALEQVHRKWWQLCWTHTWRPSKCPPATLSVDVRVVCTQPRVALDVQLEMLQCPRSRASDTLQAQPQADNVSVCNDITLRDAISAVLHRTLPDLETRVRRRVQRLAVADVRVAFDALSELSVRFHDTNALTRAILNTFTRVSRSRVNSKGASYRTLVALAAANVNASANAAIARFIGAKTSATCYDPQ